MLLLLLSLESKLALAQPTVLLLLLLGCWPRLAEAAGPAAAAAPAASAARPQMLTVMSVSDQPLCLGCLRTCVHAAVRVLGRHAGPTTLQ